MYAQPSEVFRISEHILVCGFVCGVHEKCKRLEQNFSAPALTVKRARQPTVCRRVLPIVILEQNAVEKHMRQRTG